MPDRQPMLFILVMDSSLSHFPIFESLGFIERMDSVELAISTRLSSKPACRAGESWASKDRQL